MFPSLKRIKNVSSDIKVVTSSYNSPPTFQVMRAHHFSGGFTDLKNRTGSSIYCWETEANGGHIGVTTWGVEWRHRKENENSDIFYLKLMDKMCWLDTNLNDKISPSFVWRHWKFPIWPPGGHSNMAAVGNNKSILWSPQNSLVIFMFKVV